MRSAGVGVQSIYVAMGSCLGSALVMLEANETVEPKAMEQGLITLSGEERRGQGAFHNVRLG
jgi:hypothetical protein